MSNAPQGALLFSATGLGVFFLGDREEQDIAGARLRHTVVEPNQSVAETQVEPESSAEPVFISVDDAEFLNGENIEVLADIHAEQLAEI